MSSPKVFISYAWTSEEYKIEVLELGKKLCSDGVDVILDQWDLRPGQDKYVFIEQSVLKADKVIILCNREYRLEADKRIGVAGNETSIIAPNVYNNSDQEKFIPLYMDDESNVPSYLKSRHCIDYRPFIREKQYKALLALLFGIPLVKKPTIGYQPEWINDVEAVNSVEYPSPILGGPVEAIGDYREWCLLLNAAIKQLVMEWGWGDSTPLIDNGIIRAYGYDDPYLSIKYIERVNGDPQSYVICVNPEVWNELPDNLDRSIISDEQGWLIVYFVSDALIIEKCIIGTWVYAFKLYKEKKAEVDKAIDKHGGRIRNQKTKRTD